MDALELYAAGLGVDTAHSSVTHGARLLEDFLDHEMGEGTAIVHHSP
jgi:hypothetical protein